MGIKIVDYYNLIISHVFIDYYQFFEDYNIPKEYSRFWHNGYRPLGRMKDAINTGKWHIDLCVRNKDTGKYAPQFFYLVSDGSITVITCESGLIPIYMTFKGDYKNIWK